MLAFNCIKVCVVMLFTQYLHDRAGTSASLLYKAEKPSVWSVCPSVLAALITLPSRDVSTPDLLEMKATSSGIYKFVLESF